MLSAGTYDFTTYIPVGAKYAVIYTCVGSPSALYETNQMNNMDIVGTNGIPAVCSTTQTPNGINTFTGTGWFKITGYLM